MCWFRSRDNVCGVFIGWGVSDWVILVVMMMMMLVMWVTIDWVIVVIVLGFLCGCDVLLFDVVWGLLMLDYFCLTCWGKTKIK